MKRRKVNTEELTFTGLMLAVGIILPFAASHGMGIPGTLLLPMHIPVFLCGLMCGPIYGAFCGVTLPILNCIITSMPSAFPMLPIMVCELFTYGFMSGILYRKTPLFKRKWGVYPAMLGAMVCGRLVYGLVFELLVLGFGELKALSVGAAFITGLPGIAIQLLTVPYIVFIIGKNMNKENTNAEISAKNLINNGKASCVIIKDGKIINIEQGRGIKPIIKLYGQGILKDAFVVDKVIGKAAAIVMFLGGIKECYGITVSREAVKFLSERGIDVRFDNCPVHIINRRGDGICPMEEAVLDIDDPNEALAAIQAKLSELENNSN